MITIDKKDIIPVVTLLSLTHMLCISYADHNGWVRGKEYGIELGQRQIDRYHKDKDNKS